MKKKRKQNKLIALIFKIVSLVQFLHVFNEYFHYLLVKKKINKCNINNKTNLSYTFHHNSIENY